MVEHAPLPYGPAFVCHPQSIWLRMFRPRRRSPDNLRYVIARRRSRPGFERSAALRPGFWLKECAARAGSGRLGSRSETKYTAADRSARFCRIRVVSAGRRRRRLVSCRHLKWLYRSMSMWLLWETNIRRNSDIRRNSLQRDDEAWPPCKLEFDTEQIRWLTGAGK